jgi:S-adenosylmethionine hydrolase
LLEVQVITLISDWQDNDYYIASVKGRLISHIPDVKIVDITHRVPRGGLATASYLLRNAYHNFPKGTIHIIGIMDIESKRSPHVVVSYDGHYFIGADNGQFHDIFAHADKRKSEMSEMPEAPKVFEITAYQEGMSFTFPSRDRFPVVAESIARDGDLSKIGVLSGLRERSKEPLEMSRRKKENMIVVDVPVLHVDAAGNVVLNITRETFFSTLKEFPFFSIRVGGFNEEEGMRRTLLSISKISEAYQDVGSGDGCALFLDNDYLELSINDGSFHGLTGIDIYGTVKIEFSTAKIL